ncbi:ThiF family adenylyltransferase [Aquitalea sp.]|uniref:ThiF family adenylyltransferase n=1 Tax=Aquitalea sp. TaxID=1872623 RepID=UPI00258E6975|nr:ThiF family adenylyltransferase [Aquitalea sp.]
MSEEFSLGEPIAESALRSPWSRQLLAAVLKDSEFELLGLRHYVEDKEEFELLMVIAQPDGVPSRNPFGIRCRELLALQVCCSKRAQPEALVLRRDFPNLMHLNHSLPGTPRSLCLFEEPPTAVMRSLTAPRFLARIKHWLRATATGTLHTSDQPLEPLFFPSSLAVVLPTNYGVTGRQMPPLTFTVNKASQYSQERAGDLTLLCSDDPSKKGLRPILLELPTIEHGLIEAPEWTLSGLAASLQSRGFDLYAALEEALYLHLQSAPEGYLERALRKPAPETSSSSKPFDLTLLLIKAPLLRSQAATIAESRSELDVRMYAFLLIQTPAELGRDLGVVACANPKDTDPSGWAPLLPLPGAAFERLPDLGKVACLQLEVQRALDAPMARRFSGLPESGGDEIRLLFGLGALGSHLLDNWVRMGWGRWRLVDPDTLKPHNLVRHTALATQVGRSKAEVVAEMTALLVPNRMIQTGVFDATEAPPQVFDEASLVVDATASLDAARALSLYAGQRPRLTTLFFNPRGTAAVLMLEDQDRHVPVHGLEAQYLRAVINEVWGESHLLPADGRFRTGYGCSDISHVLNKADVAVLAGTLARQLPQLSRSPEAALRVWSLDPTSGTVTTQVIAVAHTRRFEDHRSEFVLVIDEAILAKMRQWRQEQLPNETGGILVGYHDFNHNHLFVVDALPAPPDSKATHTSFERGNVGLKEKLTTYYHCSQGQVSYLGEWHTHPADSAPSSQDQETLVGLSKTLAPDGVPSVMIIVGAEEGDISVLVEVQS